MHLKPNLKVALGVFDDFEGPHEQPDQLLGRLRKSTERGEFLPLAKPLRVCW